MKALLRNQDLGVDKSLMYLEKNFAYWVLEGAGPLVRKRSLGDWLEICESV